MCHTIYPSTIKNNSQREEGSTLSQVRHQARTHSNITGLVDVATVLKLVVIKCVDRYLYRYRRVSSAKHTRFLGSCALRQGPAMCLSGSKRCGVNTSRRRVDVFTRCKLVDVSSTSCSCVSDVPTCHSPIPACPGVRSTVHLRLHPCGIPRVCTRLGCALNYQVRSVVDSGGRFYDGISTNITNGTPQQSSNVRELVCPYHSLIAYTPLPPTYIPSWPS